VADLWSFLDEHDEQYDGETFVCPGCKRRTSEGSSDGTLIGDTCCDTCWCAWQEAAKRTCIAIALMTTHRFMTTTFRTERPEFEAVLHGARFRKAP
jgi:hypothetical protein